MIPLGFIIALVVVAVVWAFLRGSVFGYEMSIIGSSPRAATYAGMSTRKITVIVFLLGGAAAGIAGVIEMLGNIQRFAPSLSNNLGYTGVVVAVLAGGVGLDLVGMALVFAVIAIGGNILAITGASSDLVFAMYGLTLICAAIGQGLRNVKVVRTQARRPRRPARGRFRRGIRMKADLIAASIATAILAATPVLIAATGELLAEMVGVYNIGIEGSMLCGALAAFIATQQTGSVIPGCSRESPSAPWPRSSSRSRWWSSRRTSSSRGWRSSSWDWA